MLAVNCISVFLNRKKILKGVSCDLERGELLLVVGPNGSGKSTLLKTIMGVIKPSSGKIMFEGIDITNVKPSKRFKMGITLAPEKMRVAENLTVEENLKISGDIDRSLKIFPELKPLLGKKCKELSGGERQMVVLARAIISNPKFLLLDEPFNGLYSDLRVRVLELIKELSKKIGVIVVTHDEIDEVLPISDKVCILVGGKVVYFGEAEKSEKVMREYMFI